MSIFYAPTNSIFVEACDLGHLEKFKKEHYFSILDSLIEQTPEPNAINIKLCYWY